MKYEDLKEDDGLVRIVPERELILEQQNKIALETPFQRKIAVIEADIESNCIEHGVRGILHHEHIQSMIGEYTEEDKQARVYGRFQHLTGLVFKTFQRRIHVIKPFLPKKEDFMVVERLDPHPRNPDAVMWVAIDSKRRKFVIDELYEKFSSVEDMAFKIKQRSSQYRIVQRKADPAAWTPASSERSEVTLASRLSELGLSYTQASKQRTLGIQLIADALSWQGNEVNGQIEFIQSPMLYVFETCERTIWEFEHWQYSEYTGKAAEKRGQSERPMDKDDHMMENLGRVFLDEPAFRPYEAPGSLSVQGVEPVLDAYK